MVIALIISIALVLCTVIICFKGISIKYDKTFTVKDERYTAQPMTETQVEEAEKHINKPTEQTQEDDINNSGGPMGSVIAEIQDLFGPDPDKEV